MKATMMTTFGEKLANFDYCIRNGVYAVIRNVKAVAAVQGLSGYFLPGGGVEEGESSEETLRRELQKECDASIEISSLIGQTTDFLFSASEERHFEKRGTFYLARFLTPPNENLVWIPLQDLSKLFRQEGHVWAITQTIQEMQNHAMEDDC